MLAPSQTQHSCDHCHSSISEHEVIRQQQHYFCCSGCQTLFNVLNQTGLANFYDILDSENRQAQKAAFSDQYEYLKDAEFLQDFAQDDLKTRFHFYIDGIECLACSWVMQNINKVSNDIQYANFSVDKNILEVRVKGSESLLKLAHFVSALGYKLIPLKNLNQADHQLNREKISQIKRIGLTGAILMNMMIYSVSIYAGADGVYKQIFGHVQAFLYLPVFLYSAAPFYKGLYNQLKNKSFTIDLPLNLSIFFGSVLSYYNYLIGSEVYYFDSLTTFIFLILSTRFALYYLYRREIAQNLFEGVYTDQQVLRVEGHKVLPKHISRIQIGDIIEVSTQSVVPLDGELTSASAYLNESLLTGESHPVYKVMGANILAGSQNLSSPLRMKVISTSQENSFHQYLKTLSFNLGNIERYSKTGNTYSIILTLIILAVSSALLYFSPPMSSLDKVLALLIVCCPCALGIGIPLASILKIKYLAKNGIIIRKNNIIEKFHQIKTLNFDKTGTLTTGHFHIKKITGDQNYLPYLVSIEEQSNHPIARFLANHFKQLRKDFDLKEFLEIPGLGPQAIINNSLFQVRSNATGATELYENGKIILSIELEEELVNNIGRSLAHLSQDYKINVISGDTDFKMDLLKEQLRDVQNITYFSNQKPKQKEQIIQSSSHSIYIGDGLNDVHAMQAADIAISLNASQLVDDVCDVTFLGGGLSKLQVFFDELKHLDRILYTNILLSVFYNTVAIYLVVTGAITPFAAAVLMPISSLIVVLHSYLRNQWRKPLHQGVH